MLIDDDQVFRSALAELLREEGHELLEYQAPGELPPIDSLGSVAVVISDYQLPGVDGVGFAAAYHAVHPAVPILLVTACSARGIELPVSLRGHVHIWPKPIDYDALHAFLHEISNARDAEASASEAGADE